MRLQSIPKNNQKQKSNNLNKIQPLIPNIHLSDTAL